MADPPAASARYVSSSSKPRKPPRVSHRKGPPPTKALAKVLQDGGPDFKQQTSSILKIDGVAVAPKESAATREAIEEARKQHAMESRRSRRPTSSDPVTASQATNKYDNRTRTNHRSSSSSSGSGSKPSSSSNKNRVATAPSPAPPVPPPKPPRRPKPVQDESVWEFDGPENKSSCCTIM